MSGYIRIPSDEWAREHYRATWTPASPAPSWWIAADVAWATDQRKLPSAREAAETWGVTKDKAARLIRANVTQQAEWEARAERKAAIRRMLEEWAAKAPKVERDPKSATRVRQRCDEHGDTSATGDHVDTPTIDDSQRQERDASATPVRQGCDTRVRLTENQPPTDQPPVATIPPAHAAGHADTPRKPKATPKPKREPHPAHGRFGPLWDAARRDARMAAYPWPKGGPEAGRTWKAIADVLDAHVSRAPDRIEGDLAQLRAAMDRFHRKPPPAFPNGHGILGFVQTVTTWLDATHRARDAPTGRSRVDGIELHLAAEALLEPTEAIP